MQQRDEQLSAFIDDELDAAEIDTFMDDLQRDSFAEREAAHRYHMIRDAMRGELSNASFLDVSAAVSRAIDAEPEIEVEPRRAQIIPFNFNLAAWRRPLTGMAVAASVAMVTVVTFKSMERETIDTTRETAQIQPQFQSQAQARLASSVAPLIQQQNMQNTRVVSNGPANSQFTQAQRQYLRQYMMDHSEFAGQATYQGVMPYARVVIFESDKRPTQ